MSQDPDAPPRAPVHERPGLGHAGYQGVSEGSTHRPVSSGCEPGLSSLSCSGSRGGAGCLVVSGVSLGGPLSQDPAGPGWSIPALPGLAVLAYLPQSLWAPSPASSHSLGAQRLATDSVPTTPLPPASPWGVAGPPGFLARCTEPHSQACLGRWQGDLRPWDPSLGSSVRRGPWEGLCTGLQQVYPSPGHLPGSWAAGTPPSGEDSEQGTPSLQWLTHLTARGDSAVWTVGQGCEAS